MLSRLVMGYAYVLTIIVAVVAAFITFHFVFTSHRLPGNAKLPPGPKPTFVVGNAAQIPPVHFWLKFKEWSDNFGSIFRFSVFGTQHYVVSTEKIANDLLRDRGANCSSREQLPAAVQLLGRNEIHLFMPVEPKNPKTEVWRLGRRFLHNNLGPNMVPKYSATHNLESLRLLTALIKDPGEYERWYERFAAGIVFRLTYGKPVETGNEHYIQEALRTLRVFKRAVTPGTYMVDVLPSMMNLPSWVAPWKKYLQAEGIAAMKLNMSLQEDVKKEIQFGKAAPSFAKTLLEDQESGLEDLQGAYLLGQLYGAGAGTTLASLLSYTLAMVLYPIWQQKVQNELDSVVGERLPTFDDLPNLPTVRAAVKETLRWRPVTAGGVPHKSVKDDVYEGFFIPAGTNIHPNQWAIHREEALYPRPETFNPDRWLSPDYPTYKEPLTKYPNLQNYSAFGFGRRICLGQYLAERSLFIVAARLAWAVDFGKKRTSDGREREVSDWDYTSGLNAQPKSFLFDLKVRSGKKLKVLDMALEEAMSTDPLRAS